MIPKRDPSPHILFVTEKWAGGQEANGLSNSSHNFFESLADSGLATHSRFHFDEYFQRTGHPCDAELLRRCSDEQPDIVFVTWLCASRLNPRRSTLQALRDMGSSVVMLWFDSAHPDIMAVAEQFTPFVDLQVPIDSVTAYRAATATPEKFLPLWTPQAPRLFSNPNGERDIDVSFVGSREMYPQRKRGLAALAAAGISVHQRGGKEDRMPIFEYADIMRRSRIVLNFSNMGAHDFQQAKGRIFEATLCGGMLLESANQQTANWFLEGREYISFSNDQDLVAKVLHFLANEEDRKEVAAAGHARACRQYTGANFWRALLERLAVPRQRKNARELAVQRQRDQLLSSSDYFDQENLIAVIASLMETKHAGVIQPYLRTLATKYPNSAESHYWCGVFFARGQRMDLAANAFKRALCVEPAHRAASIRLAQLHILAGDQLQAVAVLRELSARRPNDEQARDQVAKLLRAVPNQQDDPQLAQ